ncbi:MULTISPECIES: GDP-mannose 4,6-dehydratase [Exiguobacterium]|jgi:UDP-glucuronate 4-epimerase|uniref:GDP-mannose 4,6-dehydratase n=1 Tax=Exiguobacterium TaxID=33986 RepID=UPI001BE99F49|nr:MULTISPECIES: GDP-mannose 4,6-dehydratase [Exiguobacterium]MCT4791825.1 GDP-mannose 4,6-dehydratase [Exiguobacterium artemiae]
MKILITGGSGFIGSHLSEFLLKKGHQVVNIDNFNDFYNPQIKRNNIKKQLENKKYTLLEGDIRDEFFIKTAFKDHSFDLIVHLAAMAGVRPSIQNPLLYEDVNVKGTLNILEACKEFNVKKIVSASSSSVYGNNEKVPFHEDDVVDRSISPYASTKKSCEVTSHVYHHLYDLDVIQLRFFTVYGPKQRPDLAIHKFTKMIYEGKEIPFYGDGTSKRDYTYIDDIIDGIYKSILYVTENQKVYEIFNLGESETISLTDMVRTIENELNITAKLKRLEQQPGDVFQTYADISKAKQMLGYNPTTNFKNGIKKFVEWFLEGNKE